MLPGKPGWQCRADFNTGCILFQQIGVFTKTKQNPFMASKARQNSDWLVWYQVLLFALMVDNSVRRDDTSDTHKLIWHGYWYRTCAMNRGGHTGEGKGEGLKYPQAAWQGTDWLSLEASPSGGHPWHGCGRGRRTGLRPVPRSPPAGSLWSAPPGRHTSWPRSSCGQAAEMAKNMTGENIFKYCVCVCVIIILIWCIDKSKFARSS